MDRQYPDYPQYDYRRPWTYHSASPSAPLASLYGSSQPARPEPVASARPPQERRRSERWTGPRAIKRSIPHNGATCDNRFCDEPDISPDERLCPGPKGLNLCAKCYKRFKVERRRAMEGRRAVTDEWMRPRRPRSVPREPSPETLPRSQTPYMKSEVPASSVQDAPSPVDEKRVSWNINESDEQLPIPETRGREPTKHASPLIAPSSPSEKSSLHSVSSVSLREHDRHTSRSPRKHRSRGRDDRRYRRHSRARTASTFDEAEYFKYGRMEENRDDYDRRCCCSFWSRRRKCVVFGGITLSVIVLIIIIAVAATVSRKSGFKYTPSTAQVNNTAAFESGGATRKSVNDTSVGIGAGTDSYTYYQGNASNFPPASRWVSFDDMWTANLDTFKYSCGWLDRGADNTPAMIADMHAAIQDRANASLVDQRIILATVIQETNGCPLVAHTTSSGGTRNPGLMQSHNGHEYDPKHSRLSILLMIQDGTQGTEHGWGLVDNLNTYGDPYKAMRGYNSGYVPNSGDLSEKAGATACYVSDIANRLTGWVRAESKCPDNTE